MSQLMTVLNAIFESLLRIEKRLADNRPVADQLEEATGRLAAAGYNWQEKRDPSGIYPPTWELFKLRKEAGEPERFHVTVFAPDGSESMRKKERREMWEWAAGQGVLQSQSRTHAFLSATNHALALLSGKTSA